MYYYNGAQRYEQFLQVSWLYRVWSCLVQLSHLSNTSVSSVFMVLYIYFTSPLFWWHLVLAWWQVFTECDCVIKLVVNLDSAVMWHMFTQHSVLSSCVQHCPQFSRMCESTSHRVAVPCTSPNHIMFVLLWLIYWLFGWWCRVLSRLYALRCGSFSWDITTGHRPIKHVQNYARKKCKWQMTASLALAPCCVVRYVRF